VEQALQMLPLAGSPRLTVLRREVRLGSGFADLLAVESTGCLVIIEVKLAGPSPAATRQMSSLIAPRLPPGSAGRQSGGSPPGSLTRTRRHHVLTGAACAYQDAGANARERVWRTFG